MTNQPIDRRRFLCAAGRGPAATSLQSAQADGGTPNIVVLVTGNHRGDTLGSAGNDIIRTPHVAGLDERAAKFTDSFRTTSICAVTRASILDGGFRQEHGYTFTMPPMSVQRMDRSCPALKCAEYRSGFFGALGVEVDPPSPDHCRTSALAWPEWREH